MTAGRKTKSLSQDWGTPKVYVDVVKMFFGGKIDLDPCSNMYSVVEATTEFRLPDDGLVKEWNYPTIYVNPPYGRDIERGTSIKDWLCKCMMANRQFKSEVIALVPVATNTSHWKQYVFGHAVAICFLYDTRLKFLVNGNTGGKGAPMACAIVYWGGNVGRFVDIFQEFGATIDIRDLHNRNILPGNNL